MLLGNYNIFNANPGRAIGGITDPTYWIKPSGNLHAFTVGEHNIVNETDKSSLYSGYLDPYNVGLPMKAGSLKTGFNISGIASMDNLNLAGGLNAESTMSGLGQFTNLEGSLLAFLVASLVGSSSLEGSVSGGLLALCDMLGAATFTADLTDGITRINIDLTISGVASLTGTIIPARNIGSTMSGEASVTSALTALANLVQTISGAGTLSSDITALGNIEANITPFTELSPENLAASVWNAVATNYNATGTMGNKLNLASSGGIDYSTLADAVWESLKVTYTDGDTFGGLLNELKIKIEELHKIQGLDSTTPLTITPTSRTAGDIDLTLGGDGELITIVTRE